MKTVIRFGVFETNSSSVHSYTKPLKVKTLSFSDWAYGAADKDNIVKFDFGWYIEESGDVSPKIKLSLVLAGIPSFWTEADKDYDRKISVNEVQNNETYKEIIRRLECRNPGITLKLNESDEEFLIERPMSTDGYYNEVIFKDNFYKDLEDVIDFIENPCWKMGVHEYYDG